MILKGSRLSIFLIFFLIGCGIFGCAGGGPVEPGQDTTPPVWDDTVGVVSILTGDTTVTVNFGTATDEGSPPVEFLVFSDTDDDPFDQSPVIVATNDPYMIDNLVNGTEYWLGVRCRDSADPPNTDSNTVTISATPHEGPDTTPPVWDDTIGVVSVVNGYSIVTVDFGTAIDLESPPVEYLIFIDTDDDPFDQVPIVVTTNDPYVVDSLINGTEYWFAVRCRDSAIPPNVDDNDVVMSAIPKIGWVVTWGGPGVTDWGDDDVNGIAVDSYGDLFVTGSFQGREDLDPGPGTDFQGVDGFLYSYFSKFNSDGEYQWSRAWGGLAGSSPMGVEVDSIYIDSLNYILVRGSLWSEVDFDPGPGEEIHSGWGNQYVSKFDLEGNFQWLYMEANWKDIDDLTTLGLGVYR